MLGTYILLGIRNGIPVVVGALVTWLGVTLHVVVSPSSEASLAGLCVAVVTGLYALIARLLEAKWPNPFSWLLGTPPSVAVALAQARRAAVRRVESQRARMKRLGAARG